MLLAEEKRQSGTLTGRPSSSGSGRSRKYFVFTSARSPIVNGLRMPVETLNTRSSSGGCAAATRHALATKSTGMMSIRMLLLAPKRPGMMPEP